MRNSGAIFDLEKKKTRIKSLQKRTEAPDFWNDQQTAQSVLREINSHTRLIEHWQNLQGEIEDLAVLEQLATEEERMLAYVLMEVPAKESRRVLASLKRIDGITEAAATYGGSDIIAKVDVPSSTELDEIIVEEIERLAGVKSTHTLIVLQNTHWRR